MRLPQWVRKQMGGWDLLVVLLGLVMLVLFATVPDNDLPEAVTPRSFDWLAALLLTTAGLLLLLRHRAPLVVVVAQLVLIGLWHSVGYTNGIINAPALIAYFTVGATGDRQKQVAAIAVTVAPLVGVLVLAEGQPWTSIIDAIAWAAAGVLFGELSRSRRALMASYQRRAERAEADREAEALRRVAEERLRIARDLHDLLGHTVSVMTVQAGVAEDKFDSAPARARAAIGHIRRAGRQANQEIRATIELLRQTDELALTPTPGIAEIEQLVVNAEQLGIDVSCHIVVESDEVDPLTGLTVYRVVQEAVTNVMRHSTAKHIAVTLCRDDGLLTCTVCDDGDPSHPRTSEGFGLAGMSERVALAGGTLRHGPRAEGGFEVVATLPARGGRS